MAGVLDFAPAPAFHQPAAQPLRPRSRPEPPTPGAVCGRLSGVMLLLTTGLIVAASFLPLLTTATNGPGPDSSRQWFAWRIVWFATRYERITSLRLLGLGLGLAGAVAAVVGAALLLGVGGRSRPVRELGIAASSLSFGVTLTATLDVLSVAGLDTTFQTSTFDIGTCSLALAAVTSAAALGFALISVTWLDAFAAQSAQVPPTRTGPVGASIVLPALAGVTAIVGSLLPLADHPGLATVSTAWWVGPVPETRLQFLGIPLVLAGSVAVLSALVRRGERVAWVRRAEVFGSAGTCVLFGTTLTIVLTTVSPGLGESSASVTFELVGAGFWTMGVAFLLSCGAIFHVPRPGSNGVAEELRRG